MPTTVTRTRYTSIDINEFFIPGKSFEINEGLTGAHIGQEWHAPRPYRNSQSIDEKCDNHVLAGGFLAGDTTSGIWRKATHRVAPQPPSQRTGAQHRASELSHLHGHRSTRHL